MTRFDQILATLRIGGIATQAEIEFINILMQFQLEDPKNLRDNITKEMYSVFKTLTKEK